MVASMICVAALVASSSNQRNSSAHQGRVDDIAVYGQERNPATFRLAHMNLAIRGIFGDIRWNPEGTLPMTIIETAKLNGLAPQLYLADILDRIHDHKFNRFEELLPWN